MDNKDLNGYIKDSGFEVVEEVNIGSLSELKEERSIIPPSKNVKLRIRKATNLQNEDGSYRMINLSLAIEDGILMPDGSKKFKGMVVWGKVTYFADPKKYTKDFFLKRQHLTELKKFVLAIGGDIASIKINDEFLRSLENQVVVADIRQKMDKFTAKDGTEVENTINLVQNYRALPPESMI